MTEGGQVGIFVILAAILALIFRLLKPSNRALPIKPPANKPAADARAIIEAGGAADVREVLEDLDSADRLSRLSERADRRRRNR
mgnify:CR=1 FL=1